VLAAKLDGVARTRAAQLDLAHELLREETAREALALDDAGGDGEDAEAACVAQGQGGAARGRSRPPEWRDMHNGRHTPGGIDARNGGSGPDASGTSDASGMSDAPGVADVPDPTVEQDGADWPDNSASPAGDGIATK